MFAIDALKAFDRKEAVYLVMNDPEMKRLILAWTVYGSVQHQSVVTKSNEFNEIVEDAWITCTSVDTERLSHLADLPHGVTQQKLEILRRQGLIYPDGTANDNAMVMIRADVRAGLQKITGNRTNKSGREN